MTSKQCYFISRLHSTEIIFTVCTPLPPRFYWGEVDPLNKFSKRGGLTGPKFLDGGCWERGGCTMFQITILNGVRSKIVNQIITTDLMNWLINKILLLFAFFSNQNQEIIKSIGICRKLPSWLMAVMIIIKTVLHNSNCFEAIIIIVIINY